MNSDLSRLYDYPFTRLRALLANARVRDEAQAAISLAIGEPQHPPPDFVTAALVSNLQTLRSYPTTQGSSELRGTIADWLAQRYDIARDLIDHETMVLPVQGTREALFAAAQCIVNRTNKHSTAPTNDMSDSALLPPLVMMPAPFYQIYEGAALMAGAQPHYMPCAEAMGFVPQLDTVSDEQWQRCQLFYVCNPSNPTGLALGSEYYRRLIELADQFDFVIASDECYSEIYANEQEPCVGLLQVCSELGRHDFARCLVFNSLSKRSNLAGLRSGFVAGDAALMQAFLLYRTYHGSAMPAHHQAASIAAWSDEQHVRVNRQLYQQKITAVLEILQPVMPIVRPAGGFCLWAGTPCDDEVFVTGLYCEQQVTVLPGSYLAREVQGANPGAGYVRIALVQPLELCVEAAQRIRGFVQSCV